MHAAEPPRDHLSAAVISTVIIVNALLFFLFRDQTYVHIDAIAHVNKARGLFDNVTPGLEQLGSIWLPLQHFLIVPLAWFDFLWTTGLAGSLVSAACYVGTGVFLLLTGIIWTGSRFVGWMAFLFFALNPRLIYFFTTPMTEPLMIFCAAGLVFYLVQWSRNQSARSFAMAALFAFACTLTRYEGWAIAAAAALLVPILARTRRVSATILFLAAAVAGPMLWMLFNLIYFDDPLMFTYGIGSASNYADGKRFITDGDWWISSSTYFINAAYCLNPAVLWLGAAGIALSFATLRRSYWQATLPIAASAGATFAFYVYNLYSNRVPLLMPGFLENDPESMLNVRYGTVMAATIPLFAALFLYVVLRQADRRRAFSLLILAPMFLPDPIPFESLEPVNEQFTNNLLYKEGIHNQSFWMPPFVEIGKRLAADMEASGDDSSFVLTNTRIVHPIVWATGIPMRRFIQEMNKERWNRSFTRIDPEVRWVITEDGDQLWQGRRFLEEGFVEIAAAKTESTGTVRLYRRPD
jgi:hypothetical protein